MKIYTHPNLYQVVNVQNLLALNHIRCRLEHEYLAAGAGELAPQDVWPELWLLDDRDRVRAQQLITQMQTEPQDDWHCSQCGELNAGSFELCWHCQQERCMADEFAD